MRRILLAGILAGLAVFLWESVAHMLLPLGEMGLQTVPDEPAFSAIVKQHFKQDGLYIFPMMTSPGAPAGLMALHPNGLEELTARQLSTQFFADILVMIAAGWVLSKASLGAYFARAGFVMALAAFPILHVHVPYWNWYGFPISFTIAESINHLAGFFTGGLVLARFIKA
jgi:hypothetical protein